MSVCGTMKIFELCNFFSFASDFEFNSVPYGMILKLSTNDINISYFSHHH